MVSRCILLIFLTHSLSHSLTHSLSSLTLCPHTLSVPLSGGQILYQYRQRFEEPLSLKNCGKGYNKIKDLLLDMPDVVHIEQASGGHIVIRAPT